MTWQALSRRLLSLFAGLTLLLVPLATSVALAPAASAAPGVVVDLLSVPTSAQPGQSLGASARVRATSSTVTVQAVTIAVRSSSGAQADFPGATSAAIPTTGYTFTSATRTFAAGTYDAFVAVQISGTWYNLDPHRSFTVGGASPGVVVDSLTLPSAVPGQSIAASAKLHATSGTVAVQAVTIAARNGSGSAFDFPGAKSASIPTSGYSFTSAARTFDAGSYDVFVAVQVNGTWFNLDPHRILTSVANPMVFASEFNKTSSDPNAEYSSKMWFTDTCWIGDNCGNGTRVQYLPDHVAQSGGNLVITADAKTNSSAGTCGGYTCTSASGRLTMRDWSKEGAPTFQKAGGRFEANIQMPAGTGLWPAFWTVGDPSKNEGWPANGEIDIAEYFGANANVVHHFLHYGPDDAHDVNWDADEGSTPPIDVTQFHVYALDWDSSDNGHLTWSIDGKITRTVTAAQANANQTGLWKRIQTHPQSVILDLAVGGAGGTAPTTGWPRQMKVDYVHVYQNPML